MLTVGYCGASWERSDAPGDAAGRIAIGDKKVFSTVHRDVDSTITPCEREENACVEADALTCRLAIWPPTLT